MYETVCFKNEKKYTDMFLSLPKKIYKGDKNYIPEIKSDIRNLLLGNNPCRKFLLQLNIMVLREGTPVCRGIAFYNKISGYGSIGAFESIDDSQAVSNLISRAKQFFKENCENSIAKIYAPMNGTIWASYRLMTKGFEDKPFYGEPYNKPYYFDLLIKCGFEKAKTWETVFMKSKSEDDVFLRKYKILKKTLHKDITVRNMANFDNDIKIIHSLIMNSFSDFYLFHDISAKIFTELYGGLKYIADYKAVKIAFDKDNEPLGFGIAIPDYGDLFRKMNGKISKLKFILRGNPKRYIFLYLGTKKGSKYKRCAGAIITSMMEYFRSENKDFICALMGDNTKTRIFTHELGKIHEYMLLETEI